MAYLQPGSPRRRATALGLTVVVHVLIALLLLNLAPDLLIRPTSDALATFDVAPDSGEAPTAAPRPEAERRPERRQERARTTPPPTAPPPVPDPPIPEYLRMTREQFAATDISRLRRSEAPGAADAETASGSAGDSRAAYGPGSGPGGARLFNAEWVRRPTDAELRTYFPPVPHGSWAIVACRTIPDNRVENCQSLGESPPGSKFASGVRQAAWQFRVRPPRLGGKPMIGEWVRIRIDITERGVEADR